MQDPLIERSGITLHEKYRRLARKHLGPSLVRLFAELTGLEIVVRWVRASPASWGDVLPTAHESYGRLIGATQAGRTTCRDVEAVQLRQALQRGVRPHTFESLFGVSNERTFA